MKEKGIKTWYLQYLKVGEGQRGTRGTHGSAKESSWTSSLSWTQGYMNTSLTQYD